MIAREGSEGLRKFKDGSFSLSVQLKLVLHGRFSKVHFCKMSFFLVFLINERLLIVYSGAKVEHCDQNLTENNCN